MTEGRSLALQAQSLVDNPQTRLAIVLCLDCSPSMSGKPEWGAPYGTIGVPIDELNQGVRLFIDNIRKDAVARLSVEIGIVAFSGSAGVVLDFDDIMKIDAPELLLETEHGGTSIGSAVSLSLNLLEQRKTSYKNAGVAYFQPWLVLMTDGEPTDTTHLAVRARLRGLIESRKLSFFPIGVGEGADLEMLSDLSSKRTPLRLKGLKFTEMFEWLSISVVSTSRSDPGSTPILNTERIAGWADI